MVLSALAAAKYLKAYVIKYREVYDRLTANPPDGGGYPKLAISPYLYSEKLICYLAVDGAVLYDLSFQPSYRWELIQGVAFIVDEPDSSHTPPSVARMRKEVEANGQRSGVYELRSKKKIPTAIWRGTFPRPIATAQETIPNGMISVEQFDVRWDEMIRRLTFGAMQLALDMHLPDQSAPFWTPKTIRKIGFATADLKHKRYYNYLELIRHVDDSAWDLRTIPVRVEADIRRDFIYGVTPDGGGTIDLDASVPSAVPLADLKSALQRFNLAIERFRELLTKQRDENEAKFHAYLLEHPEILDLYGTPHSKPKFNYPKGESPLGKAYVEPDFIIAYPSNRYKLVELEKPSKKIGTKAGQSSSGVNQAAFQIAEWKTFIQNHYDVLKDKFPGISVHCSSMIVIGTDSVEAIGEGRNANQYKELLKNQYRVDDVFTYNDILSLAEAAYIRLSALQ